MAATTSKDAGPLPRSSGGNPARRGVGVQVATEVNPNETRRDWLDLGVGVGVCPGQHEPKPNGGRRCRRRST
jgi:hypothetical protein